MLGSFFFVSYLLFFAFLVIIIFLVVWGGWVMHPSTGGVVLPTHH